MSSCHFMPCRAPEFSEHLGRRDGHFQSHPDAKKRIMAERFCDGSLGNAVRGHKTPPIRHTPPHSRGMKIIGNQWNVEMDRQTTRFPRTNTTRGPAHMGASRRQCIQHNVAEQWLNAIGPIQKDHRVVNQCRCKGVLRSRSTSKWTDPRSDRKSIKCITKLLMNRTVFDPLKIQ